MPSYIKVDEQKNLFNDAKLGDEKTMNTPHTIDKEFTNW
jgi:hypothetical protein